LRRSKHLLPCIVLVFYLWYKTANEYNEHRQKKGIENLPSLQKVHVPSMGITLCRLQNIGKKKYYWNNAGAKDT
jgi:hypothetical protein